MKTCAIGKLIAVLIILAVSITLALATAEPIIKKSVRKLDDKTLEVTTMTTTTDVIKYDKAVLQTELDHIPDRRAEVQKQMDEIDRREAELIELLSKFL